MTDDLGTPKKTPDELKRERKRAYNRAYREKHRERLQECSRKYYKQNKHRWRAHYEANLKKIREYDRLRHLARKEIDRPRIRAYCTRYRADPSITFRTI